MKNQALYPASAVVAGRLLEDRAMWSEPGGAWLQVARNRENVRDLSPDA